MLHIEKLRPREATQVVGGDGGRPGLVCHVATPFEAFASCVSGVLEFLGGAGSVTDGHLCGDRVLMGRF